MRYDPSNARAFVLTFKEGALSAVAHDLRIEVERFSIDIDDEGRVTAQLDASSLAPRAAVVNGRDDPRALSSRDLEKIARTTRDEVLDVRRYPSVRFTGKREGARVTGELTLCGVTRALVIDVDEDADGVRASATLHQPDFGIRPYTAMLGTLRVKPDVRVVVESRPATRTPR